MDTDSTGAEDIRRIAKYFRRRSVAATDAAPFYEMLSDAIVWTDELPHSSSEHWSEIRLVLNHRTSVMLSRPSKYEHLWLAAKESFPEWVGFLPERSAPTEAVRKLYVDGFARMQREFDELLGG